MRSAPVLRALRTTAWWAAVAPGEEEVVEYRETEDKMYRAAVDSQSVVAQFGLYPAARRQNSWTMYAAPGRSLGTELMMAYCPS